MDFIPAEEREVRHAYFVALAGHEGQLFIEDLVLTYLLHERGWEDILATDAPLGGPELAAWMEGAASVVRRLLKAQMMGASIMELSNERTAGRDEYGGSAGESVNYHLGDDEPSIE